MENKRYDNFMVALMDLAQASDYFPVELLPMPYMQAFLWDAFDSRPVQVRLVLPDGEPRPTDYIDYVKLPSRNKSMIEMLVGAGAENDAPRPHVEEAYLYGRGKGEQGTRVWYRCGTGEPAWVVLEAIERR